MCLCNFKDCEGKRRFPTDAEIIDMGNIGSGIGCEYLFRLFLINFPGVACYFKDDFFPS